MKSERQRKDKGKTKERQRKGKEKAKERQRKGQGKEEEKDMKVRILGTGAAEGIPALFCRCSVCENAGKLAGKDIRTRSGVMINDTVLIDFSPDMLWNSRRFRLHLWNVTDLLITHSHADHLSAVSLALRKPEDYCMMPKGIGKLKIHCSEQSERRIREEVCFDGSDAEEFLYFERLNMFRSFSIRQLVCTPLPAVHSAGAEQCCVFLIREGGHTFFYGTDSAEYPELTKEFLKEQHLDAVVFDCTFGALTDRNRCRSHMNMDICRDVFCELKESGAVTKNTKCYLTHFSHFCGMLHSELEDEAMKRGFHAAYDGLEISLGDKQT